MGKASHIAKRKVLIVDDQPVMRWGIAHLIEQEADLAVCGEAEDAHGALQAIEKLKPDIVIVDISLKDGSGIELIKDMACRSPRLPVLVISIHDELFYAERVLRAGARGYLTKREPPENILEALRRILEGNIYVSESIASRMLRTFVAGKPDSHGFFVDRLSDRQFQIFELIGQGLQTREIAKRLHLSVKTIDSHRENIKGKLDLGSSQDLLRFAIQWVQFGRGT